MERAVAVEKTDYGWWSICFEPPLPLEQAWKVLLDMGGGISNQVVLSTAFHMVGAVDEFLVPPTLGKETAEAIRLGLEQDDVVESSTGD